MEGAYSINSETATEGESDEVSTLHFQRLEEAERVAAGRRDEEDKQGGERTGLRRHLSVQRLPVPPEETAPLPQLHGHRK